MWPSSCLFFIALSQEKGDSFASVSQPYISWASASSPCPRKTQMPSWWTLRATVTARWLHGTTNSPLPAKAAVHPTPMTPVPSSAPATAPPLCPGLWTTLRPRAPGTGRTQTRPLTRPKTRARKTHLLLLRQSQASLQPPPERVCAVFAEPPPYMTWKALGPTPRWRSGTDMLVKVWISCPRALFWTNAQTHSFQCLKLFLL